MKLFFAVFSSFLIVVVSAKELLKDVPTESEITVFGYLTKYGVPRAEARRKVEENLLASRIYGGETSEEGQFPYQAGLLISLSSGSVAACGGALVSESQVLTAAHCWNDGSNQGTEITVVLGSLLLFSGGTRLTSSDVVSHPSWTPSTAANDVAVINLPSAVTTSSSISPISLPTGDQLTQTFVNLAATVIGYGLTNDSDSFTTDQPLNHGYLLIVDNSVCTESYSTFVQDSNLCTDSSFGTNVCAGDSGGPVVVNRNNTPVLVGIYSFGSALGCTAGLPAVHSRVTSFNDFITENVA